MTSNEPTAAEIDPESDGGLQRALDQLKANILEIRRYELAKGAMEAMLGNPEIIGEWADLDDDAPAYITDRAAAFADAMLEKLEEKSQ